MGLFKKTRSPKKEMEQYVNLGLSIFPVIKSIDDPNIQATLKSGNPVICDHLAEGIIVTYAIDLDDHLEMIAQSHLKKFELSYHDIKLAAERNIRLKVSENCKVSKLDLSKQIQGVKPFFQVEMDNNYNPSMMIVDEFWEQAEKIAGSSLLAVSIPARNLFFFSNMKETESFRIMKPFAQQMFEASKIDHIELTTNTYIRKNGRWILFLDTPERMEELGE